MTTLPVDLFRPIVAHVSSKHDLFVLAHVSRFFQFEAERILYRSVILHLPDDPLAQTLATSRARALLVHECSVYFSPRKTHAILSILARMRNLHSLSLRGPLPPSPKGSPAFPFRLRTLCTTEPMSRPLVALIRAQPSISRLTLLHPDPIPGPIAPSALAAALPHTSALATLTPTPALALLPHRPITHLHILAWANTSLPHAAPAFAASAGPLRALMVAQGLSLTSSDLGLLAMHLPHLSFLADLSLLDAPSHYLPALSQLPLHTLLINRASPGLPPRFSEPALVRMLSASCKTLRTVVFTQRVTASYVWSRTSLASDDWAMHPVDDPCEVAADLWRAT